MTYRGINQAGDISFVARNKPNERQLHPDPNLAADGFDMWWNKTFAQHTAVVAQASALMRAHLRVSSASETRIGQAL